MIDMSEKRVVRRYDRGELRRAHKTPEGYLFADGYATRVGVFPYVQADGSIRRELRPPEEVLNVDSLGSLGRRPVTYGHPEENVTAENIERYSVGTVGETVAEAEGGYVQVSLSIHRADAVSAVVERGIQELSCGYDCELELESGEFYGVEYDAIQRKIRYNHLAIVDQGRAGPTVRLRLDEGDAVRLDGVLSVPSYPFAARERDWDAAAAEKRWRSYVGAEADEVPSKYAGGFLWVDGEKAETFGAYKLLIVDVIDGEPRVVPKAVFAVAGVLEGARGGVSIPAGDVARLKRRVAVLYRKMGKSFDDPNLVAPWERGDDDEELTMPKKADETTDATVDTELDANDAKDKTDQPSKETEVELEIKGKPEDFEKMKDELDAAGKAIANLEGKLEAMTKERDELKGQLDALKAADKKTDAADRLDWFTERIELLGTAKARGVEGELTKLDNGALRRAIVVGHTKLDVKDASDEYVRGAYEVIRGDLGDETSHLDALASLFKRTDAADASSKGSTFDERMKEAKREYHERHDAAAFRE